MNIPERNRLTMNKAVAKHNNEHKEVWQGQPIFAQAHAELEASIAGRDAVLEQQSQKTQGITGDKDAGTEMAVSMVLKLARNTAAYALNNGNHDLYAQVNYSKSYLLGLDDNTQAGVLRKILKAIAAVAENLRDYNVTPEALKEAGQAVDNMESAQTKARVTVTGKSTARLSVPQWEAKSRHALSVMDRMVYNFEDRDPAYITQYRQTRIIQDLGMRHEQAGPDDGVDPETKD